MSEPDASLIPDETFRAAVEGAATYKAAALALRLPYGFVYARSQKLGCRPKAVAEKLAKKEARRSSRSQVQPFKPPPTPTGWPIDPSRPPAPEPTPPVLSPWIAPGSVPMPTGDGAPRVREDVVAVRVDQAGRVRATVADLRDGWASWAIYDVLGRVVGKLGLRGGIRPGEGRRQAEEGADEALVRLGWLPSLHAPPASPCDAPAPVCTTEAPPSLPPGGEALRVALGAAAVIAVPRGWTEETFVQLAQLVFRHEVALSEGDK